MISDTGATTDFLAAPSCHNRLHGQRVLADGNRNTQRRAEFFAHGVHRGVQRRVFTRLAAGRHPVGRQPHVAQGTDVGGQDIGQRLGHRETARRRRVEHRHRRTFAHGHGFAGVAEVVGDRHRDIGHRHLPGPHHLVAADHAAHRAIADGNEEGLVGHGREAQQAISRVAQVDAGQRQRRLRRRHAFHVTQHLRRLA
jgi:hypothetical protein